MMGVFLATVIAIFAAVAFIATASMLIAAMIPYFTVPINAAPVD